MVYILLSERKPVLYPHEEMLQILQNPNQVVLFTYPTNPKDPFKAHAVVLAAYDPPKGFGFLNSGWERKKGDLT